MTIHFYNALGTEILCTHTYATRQAAQRALRRAAKRGQIAGIAVRRTATDAPTCHH